MITTRNLFHPSRSEPKQTEAITQTPRPAVTLALYGVVIGEDTRRAYLEDSVTKRIFAYKTGDKLAGGRVERIEPDRVLIMRAEGPVELMLRGSDKPPPAVSDKPPPAVSESPPAEKTVEPPPRRRRGRSPR